MPSLGLNAAFGLVTNLLGVRADPYQVFNFLVEIDAKMQWDARDRLLRSAAPAMTADLA